MIIAARKRNRLQTLLNRWIIKGDGDCQKEDRHIPCPGEDKLTPGDIRSCFSYFEPFQDSLNVYTKIKRHPRNQTGLKRHENYPSPHELSIDLGISS